MSRCIKCDYCQGLKTEDEHYFNLSYDKIYLSGDLQETFYVGEHFCSSSCLEHAYKKALSECISWAKQDEER